MASPFYSPFRRPPMNPFGSMMGFGMGPNLFSGGMPFYNPFPRMPMYGGGLGGFGGFGGFGGMGGGVNPFMMTPSPMQRFPRYDSLIPMQSQMSPTAINIPRAPISGGRDFNPFIKEQTKTPVYTVEEINQNFRDIMNTDPASIQSKEDLDRLGAGPLFARQRSDIFNKFATGLIPQPKQPEMTSIEQRPPMDSRPINLADVQGPIDMVDPRPIPGVDSTVGQPRTDIEQLPTPMPDTGADFKPFDPSGLQSRLDALENRPTPSFTPFDPSGLQARIGDLEGRQMFDPSGLKSRIDALENRQMPTFTPFDPTGLQSQISALQNRQMFDPTGLQTRIGDLEGRQMFDPSGLKSRISKLENQLAQQPEPQQINMADIEALIEQRLGNMGGFGISNPLLGPTPSQDFGLQTDPDFKKDPARPYGMFIGQGGPGDI